MFLNKFFYLFNFVNRLNLVKLQTENEMYKFFIIFYEYIKNLREKYFIIEIYESNYYSF